MTNAEAVQVLEGMINRAKEARLKEIQAICDEASLEVKEIQRLIGECPWMDNLQALVWRLQGALDRLSKAESLWMKVYEDR